MKKIFFLFLFVLQISTSKAQVPFFKIIQDTQLASNLGSNNVNTLLVLPFRNDYFMAYSERDVSGNIDIWYAKGDSSFNILWTHKISTPNYDHVSTISLDADSNIVVLGTVFQNGTTDQALRCTTFDTLGNLICNTVSLFSDDVHRVTSAPVILNDSVYYGYYYYMNGGFIQSRKLNYLGNNCPNLTYGSGYDLSGLYLSKILKLNDSIAYCIGVVYTNSLAGYYTSYPCVGRINYLQRLNLGSKTFVNVKSGNHANERTGASAACTNSQSNIVIPAVFDSSGHLGLWILELNPLNGDTIRTKYLLNTKTQYIGYIQQNTDFSYTMIGCKYIDSTTYKTNVIIYKLDSAFNMLTNVEYDFNRIETFLGEDFYGINKLANGEILLNGRLKLSSTNRPHYFMKINQDGCISPQVSFTKTFNGSSLHLINTSNLFYIVSNQSFFLINDTLQLNSKDTTITIAGNDSIKIQLILISSCGTDTLTKYAQNAAVGIESNSSEFSFSIQPNPSYGVFNLSFRDYSTKSIEVFDVLGKCIYKTKSEENKLQFKLDLSGYLKGFYFLCVQMGDEKIIKKIMIE